MSYLPELRASLVQAAERHRVDAAAATRTRRSSSGWLGIAVAAGVAIAVVAVAVTLVGPVRHGAPSASPPSSHGGVAAGWPKVPAPPPSPNPSIAQWTLIEQARHSVSARDPRCSPSLKLPAYNQGSPSRQMTALLRVLRHPPTAADSMPLSLIRHLPMQLYVRSIRVARDEDGTAVYILPTRLEQRPVPARCFGEERATLEEHAKGAPPATVRAAVKAQAAYLAWQQYEALHPEQVCLAEVHRKRVGGRIESASLACGWGIGEIERGLGGLATGPDGLFRGIVPDGVARVTLELPRGRRAITVLPINNVYVVRLPRGVHAPARIVWRSADGKVIRSAGLP